jgi:ketosteroid isomerase-like protein
LTAGFGPPSFLLAIVMMVWPTATQAQECEASARLHALDFWVGKWDVLQGEQIVGTSTIEKTLNGCALFEHWRDAEGGKGTSLFYYDRGAARWKQVWTTEQALAVGGTKEKAEQVEFTSSGWIRFQGQYRGKDSGTTITDRTTLTREKDAAVRQLIEISTDDGHTWRTIFDALYRGPACSASVTAAPLALIDSNNRRDIEGVLAGYTDDALWLSPDQGLVERAAFRQRYALLFRDNRLAYTAQITAAHSDGALGYVSGRIGGTITPLDGGPARSVNDTFLAVTRCEAGRWRVSHLTWSPR